jgi:hypothetical protein
MRLMCPKCIDESNETHNSSKGIDRASRKKLFSIFSDARLLSSFEVITDASDFALG